MTTKSSTRLIPLLFVPLFLRARIVTSDRALVLPHLRLYACLSLYPVYLHVYLEREKIIDSRLTVFLGILCVCFRLGYGIGAALKTYAVRVVSHVCS